MLNQTLFNVDTLHIMLRSTYQTATANYEPDTDTDTDHDTKPDLFNLDTNATDIDLFRFNYFDCPLNFSYDGFTFEREFGKLHKHFHIKYNLLYNNVPFAYLYLQQRESNNLNGTQLISLTIHNQYLYTDYLTPYNAFLSAFGLEFNNFTQLDIAADTNFDIIQHFVSYYINPKQYRFICNAKDKTDIQARINRKSEITNGIVLGKKKRKQIGMYDKSKEIQESKKHYQTEYFAVNGLDTSIPVYRFEMRLRGLAFERYINGTSNAKTKLKTIIDINQLRNPVYLYSIVVSNMQRLLEFRENTDKRIDRCTPVNFLNFVDNSTIIDIETKEIPLQSKPMFTVKTTLRKLYQLYIQQNNEHYLIAIQAMLQAQPALMDWYNAERKQWYFKYNINSVECVTTNVQLAA